MKNIDGRKLSTEAQQQLRYAAVRLCESEKTYTAAANALGISIEAVRKWLKLYKEGGYQNLKIKKRGIKLGTNRSLNQEQTEHLKHILITNTPDQLGLNFVLWTRQAIQSLIINLWGISLSLVTVSRYMKRLGFTPQKPIKRAYEQNPKTVEKWLKQDYPEIDKMAKKENAEIHWVDETGISSYSNYLRGYSPKGKTPVIKMKAKRLKLNIISSISKLGKMRFMTYKGSLNTKKFINFVGRLCKDVRKKIFVILDNLAVHHSKKFLAWLEKRKDNIEVFYLPPYSPELNPDERLNRDLKTHFHSGGMVKNETEFKKKIVSYLKNVQRTSNRILNYFTSNHVKYAA